MRITRSKKNREIAALNILQKNQHSIALKEQEDERLSITEKIGIFQLHFIVSEAISLPVFP